MNTQTMSSEQATVRHSDVFQEQLRILDGAGVGVIMCRTREPQRAVQAIRTYAFSKEGTAFANWSMTYGWEKYDRDNPGADPVSEAEPNIIPALNLIGGLGPQGGDGFPVGFYTMTFPHFFFREQAAARVPFVFAIKEYVQLFAENKRRLILLVPEGTTLPHEIQEDVVVMDFGVPSYAELSASVDFLIDEIFKSKNPQIGPEGRARLVSAGMGMTESEFESAVSRGIVTHRSQLPNINVDDVVEVVMKVKTEVVNRSEVLEVMETEDIANVGGLDNLKDWVEERRGCFSEEARRFGIEAPKGVGLFGPPGTGKSLSAKAIAFKLGLPLIKFNVGRVFQSLVGQSEERVEAALKMLEAMAPCVAFIDEIDKVFQRTTSGGDSGVGQRVMGAILSFMQDSDSPIFWVMAGNRVDNLPSEILRRGRLDEIFSVSIPNAHETGEIFNIHLGKRGHEVADLTAAIGASVNRLVPSEIEQAVKDTLIHAFSNGLDVTDALLAEKATDMRALSDAFAADFEAMRTWAEQNAKPANAGERPSLSPTPTQGRTRRRRSAGQRSVD